MGWRARMNMEETKGLGRSEEDPQSYAARRKMKVARAAARQESREASPLQPVLQGVAKALSKHTYNGMDQKPVEESSGR